MGAIPSYAYFPVGTYPATTSAAPLGVNSPVIPLTAGTHCGKYLLFNETTMSPASFPSGRPTTAVVSYHTVTLPSTGGQVTATGSLPYTEVLSSSGAPHRMAASGPDAAGNFHVAIISPSDNPGDSAFVTVGREVYHNKLVVYRISPSGVFTHVATVKGGLYGELADNKYNFDGRLSISPSGRRIAWRPAYTSSGFDVVYVNLDAPIGDRVRTISFNSSPGGFNPNANLVFNPLNENVVFLYASSPTVNGITSLNYQNAYATPAGQPSVRNIGGTAYTHQELFIGFNKVVYTFRFNSNSIQPLQYNHSGLTGSAPPVSFMFALGYQLPASITGWHYNHLKVMSGPTNILVPSSTSTVSATFTGPQVQSGAAVSYSWSVNGGPQVGNTRTFTWATPYGVGTHTIRLTTILTLCGRTYSNTQTKTLVVSVDPCPGCRPSPPTSGSGDELAVVPTIAAEEFTLTSANPETEVAEGTPAPLSVQVLNSFGQAVLALDNYTPGASIAVRGWQPGLYQVLTTDTQGARQRHKLLVSH